MITLVADSGYAVRLHSLELGGWFQADYTINALEVWSDDVMVWVQRDFLVQGSMAAETDVGYSSQAFEVPVVGSAITIVIDSANLGRAADNIGVDNVAFSQVALGVSVPEPAGLGGLMLLGVLGGRRVRSHLKA
jgi:hypothetical protein